MIDQVKQRVEGLIQERFKNEPEYFLVDVKVQPKKIQVFIDGDKGININKCAEISRYLEKFLDEEKIAGEDYVLEVSSPGMTNPLKVTRQYKRRIGESLDVLLNNGEKITGILREANEETIEVELTDGKPSKKKLKEVKPEDKVFRKINFNDIKSTKILFQF